MMNTTGVSFKLLLMFSIISQLMACKSKSGGAPLIGRGSQDCTTSLYNETLRFESLYYKSYWLNYYSGDSSTLEWGQRSQVYDHEKGYSWRLEDCGHGYGCLRSLASPSHWIAGGVFIEFKSKMPRDKTKYNLVKIWCDSCDKLQRCQIFFDGQSALYPCSSDTGFLCLCNNCGESDWFDWDIMRLKIRGSWVNVETSACNRTPRDIGVHFSSSHKVGLSRKAAETHGISEEISFSLQNNPLTVLGGFKISSHHDWTTEETKEVEQTMTVTIRGANGTNGVRVPPNKRAVVKQLGMIWA